MKHRNRLAVLVLGLFTTTLLIAATDKWVITQATMSKICTVQKETSRPLLGRIIGTYNTKEEAEKARTEMQKTGDCQ